MLAAWQRSIIPNHPNYVFSKSDKPSGPLPHGGIGRDKKSVLVEKIKSAIVEMIHYADEKPKIKFSVYLSEKLNYDYTYLANLFSEVKGITIEHFIISHKIERAKELLSYTELSVSEIASRLHYSSISHLSSQFKDLTGLSPSYFKGMKLKKRIPLENL
jgi:AraC-like DNA-binding protein